MARRAGRLELKMHRRTFLGCSRMVGKGGLGSAMSGAMNGYRSGGVRVAGCGSGGDLAEWLLLLYPWVVRGGASVFPLLVSCRKGEG